MIVFLVLLAVGLATLDVGRSLAARALMADKLTTRSEEEQDMTYLAPGFHSVAGNEGVGHISFYLDMYLLAEKHAAIHASNTEYDLIALNLNMLPEDADTVLVKDFRPDADTLCLINVREPIEDDDEETGYHRTTTRAVYTVERMAVMSVLRGLSARVPFNTSNMGGINALSEESNDNSNKWKPDCDLDVAGQGVTNSCYMNWDKDNEDYPNPIFDSIPVLIGGAKSRIDGEFVFDKKNDTIRAGAKINADIEAKAGLHFDSSGILSISAEEEIEPTLYNVFTFTVYVIIISVKVGLGVELEASVDINGELNFDYLYTVKVTTPNSLFIGYDDGPSPNKEGKKIDLQLIPPETSLKDIVDNISNSNISFTGMARITPYFRIEFGISVVGISAGLDFDFGADIISDFYLSLDKSTCTTFPYIKNNDVTIKIHPFSRIKTSEIKLWIVTLVEAQELIRYPPKGDGSWGTSWKIDTPCLFDRTKIKQKTIEPSSKYGIMVQPISLTSSLNNLARLEVYTSSERCTFNPTSITSNNYCVLDEVDESDYIYVTYYYTSIFELFGYINKYSRKSNYSIKNLSSSTTLTKNNTTEYSAETNGKWSDISSFQIGINKFLIPTSTTEPENVVHTKGSKFYSMLKIPAGKTTRVSALLNIDDGSTTFWTNGEVNMKYYTNDLINSGSTYVYSFNPNIYIPKVLKVNSIKSTALIFDLGVTYCVGNASNSNMLSDCKKMSGSSIIDISGDMHDVHPIENGTTITYPETDRYTLHFSCGISGITPKLAITLDWNNNPNKGPAASEYNLCDIAESEEKTFKYDDSITKYTVTKDDYRIPLVYTPPSSNYVVKSSTYAVNEQFVYSEGTSSIIYKLNDSDFKSEYGVISINITSKISNINTNKKVGLIVSVYSSDEVDRLKPSDKVDWLKPSEYLGYYGSYHYYVITTDVTHNTNSNGTYYWLNIPFRFKGGYSSVLVKLVKLFNAIGNSAVCNTSNVDTFYGNYIIGCVRRDTAKLEDDNESLIYTVKTTSNTYINGVAGKSQNGDKYILYLISNVSNVSEIYVAYTKYAYKPDSSVAVSIVPNYIGTNYNNNVYTKIVSNGCYQLKLSAGNYTLTLNKDEYAYISNRANSGTGKALADGSEGTITCYCEPTTSSNSLSYDSSCIFQVDEDLNDKVYLLTSNSPAGIHEINESNSYSSVIAYANSQFIKFNSSTSYSFDKSGSYTYKSVNKSSIKVVINRKAVLNNQNVVSISVTTKNSSPLSTRDTSDASDDIHLPISNEIFVNNDILKALVKDPDSAKNRMYLESDGTLYLDPNDINDDIDVNSLTNICYPYEATSVTIPSKCNPGFYYDENTSDCKTCTVGNYCQRDMIMVCNNNTYQPNEGQSSCIPCGDYASPNDTYTSCNVNAGYYIVEGSFNGTDTPTIDSCPMGYYCINGGKTICNINKLEYSDSTGSASCSICDNDRELVLNGNLAIGCKECDSLYQYNGNGQCVPMDGYYLKDSEITLCEENYYCIKGKMEPCPEDTFSEAGSTFCTEKEDLNDCPSTDLEYCNNSSGEHVLCSPGHYCQNGIEYECSDGYIQKCAGAGSCNKCEEHTHTNKSKTICIPDNGYYRDKSGVLSCESGHYCVGGKKYSCPEGYIQPDIGMTSCTIKCLDGSETSDHINCIAKSGYYISEIDNLPHTCEPGYYCTGGEHRQCGDNKIQPEQGKLVCQECPDLSSTKDHINCIANTGYYMVNGEVLTCPVGHICNNGGIMECGEGQYQDNTGMSTCKTCADGTFPADSNGNIVASGGVKCVSSSDSSNIGLIVGIVVPVVVIVVSTVILIITLKKKGIICN